MNDNGKIPERGTPQYERPQVARIDLALEETLSSGCKVGASDCNTDAFPTPGAAAGS